MTELQSSPPAAGGELQGWRDLPIRFRKLGAATPEPVVEYRLRVDEDQTAHCGQTLFCDCTNPGPITRFLMFSNRRRLRQMATRMLFVWLFSLAMGVANACALGESTQHQSTSDTVAQMGPLHHDEDEDLDHGQANCLDFCEKSSVGAPKLQTADDSLTSPGFAVLATSAFAAPASREPLRGWSPVESPHLHGRPPLRIAYQRLAL